MTILKAFIASRPTPAPAETSSPESMVCTCRYPKPAATEGYEVVKPRLDYIQSNPGAIVENQPPATEGYEAVKRRLDYIQRKPGAMVENKPVSTEGYEVACPVNAEYPRNFPPSRNVPFHDRQRIRKDQVRIAEIQYIKQSPGNVKILIMPRISLRSRH